MKVRTGFVTNSSSSSFVVVFDKIPESMYEVQSMLFGNKKNISYYDETISTLEIATRVFKDIQSQSPNDRTAVIDNLRYSSNFYIKVAETAFIDLNGQLNRKAYDDFVNTLIDKKIEAFLNQHNGKYIFTFHYADDNGEAILEHGEIFSALTHIRISNH